MKKNKEITITLSKERFIEWLKLTLLGGVFIIAPVASVYYLFHWLFNTVRELVSPITGIIQEFFSFGAVFSDLVSISLIISSCFITGLVVKTSFGKFIHGKLDGILEKVPGYQFIRNLFKQLLTGEGLSFADKKPAIIEQYGKGNGLLVGFIMDYSELNDLYSVFCPSAPNPTSGYTFTVSASELTHIEKTSGEDVLKVITFCGMGTASIIDKEFGGLS